MYKPSAGPLMRDAAAPAPAAPPQAPRPQITGPIDISQLIDPATGRPFQFPPGARINGQPVHSQPQFHPQQPYYSPAPPQPQFYYHAPPQPQPVQTVRTYTAPNATSMSYSAPAPALSAAPRKTQYNPEFQPSRHLEYAKENLAANYTTGIKLRDFPGQGLQVAKVVSRSSAQEAGVSPGDMLTRVAHVNVTPPHYDTREIRRLLKGRRGSRVTLAFRRLNGQEYSLDLVRNVRSASQTSVAGMKAAARGVMVALEGVAGAVDRKMQEALQKREGVTPLYAPAAPANVLAGRLEQMPSSTVVQAPRMLASSTIGQSSSMRAPPQPMPGYQMPQPMPGGHREVFAPLPVYFGLGGSEAGGSLAGGSIAGWSDTPSIALGDETYYGNSGARTSSLDAMPRGTTIGGATTPTGYEGYQVHQPSPYTSHGVDM